MNIPSKVKVGGHYLDVKITNDKNYITENQLGRTILAKNIMYLNMDYPRSQQEEALLHEIIHNIYYELGTDQTEEQVQALGGYLYQIIIDNKELFL